MSRMPQEPEAGTFEEEFERAYKDGFADGRAHERDDITRIRPIIAQIRTALEFRGSENHKLNHVALTRADAEILLEYLEIPSEKPW